MYMDRLRSALLELGIAVAPLEVRVDDVPAAVGIVGAFADALLENRLKELKYGTKANIALLKALREQRRSASPDDPSVREEQALAALLAHQHAHTLLEHGDVALGARVAAMIDETSYKEQLWTVYRSLLVP